MTNNQTKNIVSSEDYFYIYVLSSVYYLIFSLFWTNVIYVSNVGL